MSNKNADHYFLRGGGDMGELIRAKDWSKTALGDPAQWPQSLCTMVAVMLDNPFGMYIAWGNGYIQLYNDGYRPILGATKHPRALGISTRETFSEIWHIIESMFDGVMKGKAVGFPDFMLPLNRYGYEEACYFDFSYSPIRKDNGEVGGVLVTVIETTEKKRATAALKESNDRYIRNIMQAPVAMCIFRGKNYVVEIANEQMLHLWGKQAGQVMNKPIFEGLPEAKGQGLDALLEKVYTTGEKFVANERPVNLPRNGKVETTYVNFVYDALKETDGTISGIVATAIEVTQQVIARSKVEEGEQKVRALVENAPFPIAVYAGKEMIVELANQSIINIWGKGNDVIGKSFKSVLPELDNQLVFEQVEKVLTTGESFHTKNTPLDLFVDGNLHTYYFNYSFTPLHDINGNIYGVMNTGVDVTDLNVAKKRIEDSEEQLRIAIEGGEFGTFDFTPQANQLIWSAKTKELFGLPPDARADYETYIAALHPEDRGTSRFIARQQADLKEGGLYELEYRTIGITDGKLRWLRSKGKATYNKEGEPIRYTGVIQDITKQKESAEIVRESNLRFRNTVKQAPVGITILRGPQYTVEMANDAYLQLVGKNEREFVGQPLFDALPEVQESIHSLLDSVINTGMPYHGYEVAVPVNRYGKQEICYFDFLYHPLKEEDEKISGVIAIVTEVTEKVETRKKIEERKRLYETITQNTPDLIYVFDLSYRFTYTNEALLKMWGRTWDDSIGKGMLEVGYEPWHAEMHEREIDQVIATKKPVRGEVSFPHATLGKRIYDYILVPVIDQDGKVEAIAGTTRDITQQVEARQQIEESEMRFRNTVAQAPVAIAVLRGENYVVEVANEKQLQLWGKTKQQVLNIPIFAAIPEGSGQGFEEILKGVFTTGKPFIANQLPITLIRNGNKETFYSNFTYEPLYNGEHKIDGIISIATDVTEQVFARKKIEESEERFRSLAETLPQLIWVTDATGNAEFASLKWKEYSGIEPGSETAWKEIVHPDDYDNINAAWAHSLTTGNVYKFDVRFKSKDGGYRWHRVIGEPVFDKENKIVKWVGAFTDIQTEKAFTQELEKQVAERTQALEDTNIELGKMNKELESFAYISSHDLQEPLRKIQTFSTQIIEKESQNLSASGKEKFNRMQNAAKRMQTLIDDLLTYSRTNTAERKFEKTDLSKIIEEVKEDLKEELQQKQATIEANDICEADIIPFQFRQLLFNLVNNSLKFSNPNEAPRIEIKSEIVKGSIFNSEKLARESTYCHLRVSDNGIGFEDQYSERIFEVFQRLHGKNEYNGTGIGLSIVKKIVENHNGVITATGVVNKGATFDIYIPAN